MKIECCKNCGYSMSRVGKYSIECWRWVNAGDGEVRPAEEIVHLDHHCCYWKPQHPDVAAAMEQLERLKREGHL